VDLALEATMRVGRVSSVDAAAHTVKVLFEEDSGFVTFDLPVLVSRPGDYALPEVNAAVLCLMATGSEGIGYVVGSLYSEADAPPLSDAGKRSIASDDLRLASASATAAIALATKVADELEKIKTAHNTHVHVLTLTMGTGTAAPPLITYTPASVAAMKVKAE
jgi:hypothetical protein